MVCYTIDSLYEKGFLSEFNLGLEEEQYYENILNSYATENGVYAYPTFFDFTVLVSSEETSDATKIDTFEEIFELIPDAVTMDVFPSIEYYFDVFYEAMYFHIFPDNQTVSEATIKEFLIKIKKIYTPPIFEENGNVEEAYLEEYLEEWEVTLNKIDDRFRMSTIMTLEENEEVNPFIDGNYTNNLKSL